MDWFKRAPGVKIFLFIWLLVLILPLWRLRATRQWQNDQLTARDSLNGKEDYQPLTLGFTRQNEQQAAHQFPNDAAAQLAALSGPNLGRSDLYSLSPSALQKATDEYFTHFAALSRRFPRDLPIRAQWLRDATQGSLPIESKGLMATYNYPPNTVFPKPWMSVAQIQAAVTCAREGAKQEPDNAFWPWMEAIFHFALSHDDEALKALEKAGKCSRFNDKTLENARHRIALMRRVQVCDTEDELWEAWAITFPHFSRLRSTVRQAMWNAKLAHQKGDEARALEIAGIVQRAAWPVARPQDSFIGQLVGEALAYISWGQTLQNAGIGRPNRNGDTGEETQRMKREFATRFAAYARRNGRDDLGRQALQIQSSFNSAPLIAAMRDPQYDHLQMHQNRLNQLHWLGSWLLKMAVFGGLIWGVSLLPRGWDNDSSPRTRRGVAIWSAFCVGATAAILAAALRLGAVNSLHLLEFSATTPEVPSFDFERYLPFVLAAVWLVPVLLTGALANVRWPRLQTQSRGWQHTLLPLALYAGTLGSFMVLWDVLSQPLDNSVGGQLWPAPPLVFGAFLLATFIFKTRNAAPLMRVSATLLVGAILCWIGWLYLKNRSRGELASSSTPQGNDDSTAFLVTMVICIVLAIGLWIRSRGLQIILQNPFWSDLRTRTRLAAATVAVCSSVAYFLLIFAAMPLRHHAQQVLNAHIEKGEAVYIEEKLARKS